jgi:3-carboxy-cis,cis-muconate cycloisomerase
MAGEHERAAGSWQSEWNALSQVLAYCGGAASSLREALDGLTVDAGRMAANLEGLPGDFDQATVDALIDRALAAAGEPAVPATPSRADDPRGAA